MDAHTKVTSKVKVGFPGTNLPRFDSNGLCKDPTNCAVVPFLIQPTDVFQSVIRVVSVALDGMRSPLIAGSITHV